MERYFNGCSIENFELSGKVAVITDGNTPLGQNYAIALARAGVKLIIHTNDTKWDQIRRLIEKEGQEVIFFKGDLNNEQDRKNLIDMAIKIYGKLDILINNIEIIIKYPLFIHDNEYYNEIIDKKLSYTYLLIKEADSVMKKNNYGKIINLMMVDSFFRCDEFAYKNSNELLERMTRELAKELVNDNIQINCLNNISKNSDPIEIARAIVFFASNLSDKVNGDVISL